MSSSWWNPFSSSAPVPAVPKSPDGGYIAPDRSSREKCYEARDLFFDCLDANSILDANKNGEEVRRRCGEETKGYERDCAKSWIKYFNDKRVMEYKRDKTIEKIKQDDEQARHAQKDKKGGRGLFG